MKKSLLLLLSLLLTLSTGCGASAKSTANSQPVELVVFAAGSLTESFTEIGTAFEQKK